MSLVDEIARIIAQPDLDEDERRSRIYALKANALRDVVQPYLGRTVAHDGYTFRINSVEVTPQHRLALDVTFARGPNTVTHQIIITNPPVLPRQRTGNERNDLLTAISEMLEGFV